MAKKYSFIDLGFIFRRSNAKPLDDSSVWQSYEDAVKYASGQDKLHGAPYAGQMISVVDGEDAVGYIIKEDGTLKRIGEGGGGGSLNQIVSDDNSIKVVDKGEGVVDVEISAISNPEIEIPIN